MCLRLLQLANGSCNEQTKIKSHIFRPRIVWKQCFCIGSGFKIIASRSDLTFFMMHSSSEIGLSTVTLNKRRSNNILMSACVIQKEVWPHFQSTLHNVAHFIHRLENRLAELWKKGVGPIMSNFWGLFFKVFMDKKLI